MSIRMTPNRSPGTQQIAFHPNQGYGICIRAEHDGVMVIWNNGYRKVPYSNISSSWFTMNDDYNRRLPIRICRPWLSLLVSTPVIEVDFLR